MVSSKALLSPRKILCHHNPLDDPAWDLPKIQIQEIQKACRSKSLSSESWNQVRDYGLTPCEQRVFHIERIAFLATQEIDYVNDAYPISIQLDITGLPYAQIIEGRHRVLAALVKGTEKIHVLLHATEESEFLTVFPNAVLTCE